MSQDKSKDYLDVCKHKLFMRTFKYQSRYLNTEKSLRYICTALQFHISLISVESVYPFLVGMFSFTFRFSRSWEVKTDVSRDTHKARCSVRWISSVHYPFWKRDPRSSNNVLAHHFRPIVCIVDMFGIYKGERNTRIIYIDWLQQQQSHRTFTPKLKLCYDPIIHPSV